MLLVVGLAVMLEMLTGSKMLISCGSNQFGALLSLKPIELVNPPASVSCLQPCFCSDL